MKTSWFIPGKRLSSQMDALTQQKSGHSLESFPEQMAAVRDAGHEIGLHGYSHEVGSLLLMQTKDR
jgi:peptidoglycan/xylan/chitin deacetylase (PgdA/CDA1 family)